MERNDDEAAESSSSHQRLTIHIPSSPSAASSPISPPPPPQQHLHHHADREEETAAEIERMFDKALTPSDVGKLNRLVIPKQQAERHFPLMGSNGSTERGTELSFTDIRTGRQWQFRYCYWGSSQSYVMTKGWSRFVKENNLTPGDTVLFLRDVTRDQFMIDYHHNQPPRMQQLVHRHEQRPMMHHHHSAQQVLLDFSAPQPVRETGRRVRLFGVNIDSDREDHHAHGTARIRENSSDWGPRSI